MRLTADDLRALSQCAMAAATEAGQLIAQYNGREVAVERKEGGESLASQVVTAVDGLSQTIVLKHLLPTCATYDLALLTEEQADDGSRLVKDYFWCIDPLDGTLVFTESVPGYSVSIALVDRAGAPQLGVVYDPITGNLYSAVKGQGALLNGAAWELTEPTAAAPLSFISDRSIESHPRFSEIMDRLAALAQDAGCGGFETHLRGGGVMNAIWVLERAPACYFKFPKPKAGGGSFWDFAATACLYAELGAWVSDFAGQPLELNRADTTFMNAGGVLFASDAELARRIREEFQVD